MSPVVVIIRRIPNASVAVSFNDIVIICKYGAWINSVFRSGTDLTSLLILFLLMATSSKSLRLRRLKTDQDEIGHDCASHNANELIF